MKALVNIEEKFDIGTRKSSLDIDTTNPTVIAEQFETSDMTMEQQLDFTNLILKEVFEPTLPKLIETAT